MFVDVKLLNGFEKSLTYALPAALAHLQKGAIVCVPLRNRTELAIIENIYTQKPTASYEFKEILALQDFPNDAHYTGFLQSLTNYYDIRSIDILKRVKSFLNMEHEEEVLPSLPIVPTGTNTLTDEQQAIFEVLLQQLEQPAFKASLLHGVTGSGKSEIYKKLIEECIKLQKSAIFLLPEVTLALEFEKKFKLYFNNAIEIFAFHSGVSVKDKKLLWSKLLQGKPILIIGVHLPALLPIEQLGLIIVDEEHEVGYQEKKHPKINSKEAALMRAQEYKIPIILGSATPSITTLYNVKHKGWGYFKINKRFNGEFPAIKVVKLIDKEKRFNFWVCNYLKKAIQERLDKKEQTILFLNRRGFSFFVQCKDCGFIVECKNCSISLTLHENGTLNCHYCSYSLPLPPACLACNASKESLIKKGIGTQQVVKIIQDMFPHARIARADLDVSAKKKLFAQTIKDFDEGAIDILIGTQTIAKGFHFPNVTLVGILWADINLSFPVYNATETALQQLIQVAGRSGRQKSSSEVVVQMMASNRIEQYIDERLYDTFYESEIEYRQLFNYPPFARVAEFEVKNKQEKQLDADVKRIESLLLKITEQLGLEVFGPSVPPISKLKNHYRKTFFIKARNAHAIKTAFDCLKALDVPSDIFFTPNPVT